jgi:uncharacterized protein YndB with AHSA1/START domain
MTTTSYTLRGFIASPPSVVYAALTEQAALETWLAEHAEAALDQGKFGFWGRYTPDGEPGRQRLLGFESDRQLSFAWTYHQADTKVDIELEPASGGTTLTFTHSGVPDREGYSVWVRDFCLLSLANLASYAEGRQLAPKCDFTAFAADAVRAEVEIDAPPAAVFASLIEPEQLDRWIAEKARVEPEVGGAIDFGWDHGPVKILELEPDRVLAFSWQHQDDSAQTVVRWELAGSGGCTHLTIVHSGFGDRPTDTYQLGWQEFLVSLKRMHELGAAWQPLETVAA